MTNIAKPAIIDRSEPILGVCEALGDDFGISAHWFRAALFPLLLWSPFVTAAGYVLVASLVLVSRLVFPDVCHDAPEQAGHPIAPQDAQESEPISVLLAA